MASAIAGDRVHPYQNAAELRDANVRLLEQLNRRLEHDNTEERERSALVELESQIRVFLERGAGAGVLVEDVKERTACQVLLDYWGSELSHAGVEAPRARLASFDVTQLPDLADEQYPYVGLNAFRSHTSYFGREKAVESLLERVATTPLVAVQGPSSSGKSSLVMGGAVPRLTAPEHVPRYRVVGPFAPADAVLERLVEAVASALPGSHLDVAAEVAAMRAEPGHLAATLGGAEKPPAVLVIDQFDEVFTLSTDQDRGVLAANLAGMLQARRDHRAILTLREEFSGRLEELEALRPFLAQHARFSVKEWPMGYEDLKAVVEKPAARVNLQFQPGIVDHMVKSVLGSPDTALPLLQFTLRLLWERREHNRITWEAYRAIGGNPHAALARFAEGLYDSLGSDEERVEVERILLELVGIDRMLEPYRQRVLRSALLDKGTARSSDLLTLLERNGLVHVASAYGGRDSLVKVSHEALLRDWPRYQDWIGAKRERVRQRMALTEMAQRWERRGKSPSRDLLTGWQLQEVLGLPDLTGLEKEYAQASQKAFERAARRKKTSWVAATLVAAAVVFGVVFMVVTTRQAEQSRRRQDLLMKMADAKEAALGGKLDHALTLALEATRDRTEFGRGHEGGTLRYEARATLFSALRAASDVRRLFVKPEVAFQAVAFHPTRREALMAFGGSDGKTYLAGLGEPFAETLDTCGTGLVTALAFDPAGRWLAAACADGTVSIWSESGTPPRWTQVGDRKQVFDRTIWTIAPSRDGRLLAAGGYENKVRLVAVGDDGRPRAEPAVEATGDQPQGFVWSLAFSPIEDRLVVGDGAGGVLTCEAGAGASWTCTHVAAFPKDDEDAIRAMVFSPDGTSVAVGRWKGGAEVWDPSFTHRWSSDVSQGPGPVYSLAFFENCSRRYLAVGKGTGLLYRAVSPEAAAPGAPGRCTEMLAASVGDEVYGLASHGPSGLLAAATHGGYVAVIDPARTEDRLRTVVAMPTKKGEPVRGAVLADQEATARIAIPIEPTGSSQANLAVLTVRDGVPGGGNPVTLAAGEGEIRRLSAGEGRLLATLSLQPGTPATNPVVAVWRFDEGFRRVERILSLGTGDLDGLNPTRVALSPDGRWLAVSLSPPWRPPGKPSGKPPAKTTQEVERWCTGQPRASQVLVVAVAKNGERTWVDTGLCSGFHDMEIAFSTDGQYFAAGGDAMLPRPGAGPGRVQAWKVGTAGFERVGDMELTSLANKVFEVALAATATGGRLLVAGGEYGEIDIRDVGGAEARRTKRADSRPVWLLAFRSRGSLLAAADSRNVVRLWSLEQYERPSAQGSEPEPMLLSAPTDQAGPPGFLAFGGNGQWLASGAWLPGSGGTLHLWDLGVDSLRRKACSLLREPGMHGAEAPVPTRPESHACHAP